MASSILIVSRRQWQRGSVSCVRPRSLRCDHQRFFLSFPSRKTSKCVLLFRPPSISIQPAAAAGRSSSILSLLPLYTTLSSSRLVPLLAVFTVRRWAAASSQQPHWRPRSIGANKSPSDLTVSDILNDYIQNHKQLKEPSQVSTVWNKLGKAVQNSRKREQQSFWSGDHQSCLQTLVDQTIQSTNKLNGRSTATVTHSLAKLLHLTNSKCVGEILSLWNALLHQTILHVQSGGFNAFELSNLLWAYAKVETGEVDGKLLNDIVSRAVLCIDDFSPQGLANVAWGFATLNREAPSLFDSIAIAARGRIHEFKPQELANTAWAFATLKHEAPSLFDAIARAASIRIDNFIPQALSNTAWAFATLRHEAPLLFNDIANAAQVRIDEFNPQELSNTAWSFATIKHEAPLLFDVIENAAQVRIDEFNPQELSNTAWAFATIKHEAPLLFDVIANATPVRIDEFNPQELSNMAWSFATIKHRAPLLFDAIARAAPARIGEFKAQELSKTAWAFAAMKHEAPSLFDAIARAAPGRIGEFNEQSLSNTAWAFATLKHEAPSLFDAIARAAPGRIGEFNEQSLSNTAWAFATLKHEAPSLFDAIARAASIRIDDFSSQALSSTAWAYATLNHVAPSLFDAVARAAQIRIKDFIPYELSNTAWAFATLNHVAPSLFSAIARAATVRVNEFNSQDLAKTAWSFAVFDIEPNSFTQYYSPFAQALLSRDPSTFSVEGLSQLQQLTLWHKEHNGARWYPEELSQLCWQAFVSAEAEPSRLQNDVVVTLGKLQDVSQVEVEVSTKSGYTLDAVVVFRGERIGVEVDGPSHFVGQSQLPNGSTILKRRQVRALEGGGKLVAIAYWEWDRINVGSHKERRENKQRYLQNLLDEVFVSTVKVDTR
jgi:RAP domain